MTISGGDSTRVFYIPSGATVTLKGLIIAHGNTNGGGGGLYNAGSATLDHVTFYRNKARGGGGMYNKSSSVSLSFVIFQENTAYGTIDSYGAGGGMYNTRSSPVLNHVTFIGNVAQQKGGGGFLMAIIALLN